MSANVSRGVCTFEIELKLNEWMDVTVIELKRNEWMDELIYLFFYILQGIENEWMDEWILMLNGW